MKNQDTSVEVNFSLISDLVRSGRKGFVFGAFLFASAGVIRTYISVPVFESKAVLLLASENIVASNSNPFSMRQVSPFETLKGMLLSENAANLISAKFQITPKEVKNRLTVKIDEKSNQLIISTTAESRKKAEALGDFSIKCLQSINSEVSTSKATEQFRMITNALLQEESKVESASSRLNDFQSSMISPTNPDSVNDSLQYLIRYKSLQDELKVVEDKIAAIKGTGVSGVDKDPLLAFGSRQLETLKQQLVESELDLKIAKTKYSDGNPEVTRLKMKLDVIKDQIRIEAQNKASGLLNEQDGELAPLLAQRNVLRKQVERAKVVASSVGGETLAQQKLYDQLILSRKTVQLLREKRELARVDSMVDKVLFSVLDAPKAAEQPTNKNYLIQILVHIFLGQILILFWIVFKNRTQFVAKS